MSVYINQSSVKLRNIKKDQKQPPTINRNDEDQKIITRCTNMKNWKCPVCGNKNNSSDSLRCLCGHEISEQDISLHLTKPIAVRKAWKDALCVMAVSAIVSILTIPFEKYFHPILNEYRDHNSTIIGYWVVMFFWEKIEIRHIFRIVVWVWAMGTILTILMFWRDLGTKYSIQSIILGTLWAEIISAAIALGVYYSIASIKKAISNRNLSTP